MMKLHKFIYGGLMLMGLASCSEQMDYRETNVYDWDYVVKNFNYVGGFMTEIYNHADYDYGQNYSGAMLASASDESQFSATGNSIETFYNGTWSPSNANSSVWKYMYDGIRVCNTVLTKFQDLKFDELVLNPDYEQQMFRYENYKWEARFWRAYFYFNLVRQYGGVPIVTPEMTTAQINSLSRNTSDEVYDYIFKECDEIKDNIIKDYGDLGNNALPNDPADDGRVNNLAVMALKARAALYWASPLNNPGGEKERYHKAALYTKQLLDACKERGMKLLPKYEDLWSTTNYQDKSEIIFGRRLYGTGKEGASQVVEKYNYPFGIEGGSKASNCPTQNMVDAYEMQATGKGINEEGSGYKANDPYKGRDPRLEATIAKNGDVWPTSYKTALQTYEGGTNAEPNIGATPTGYYLKKHCHGTIDLRSKSKYTVDNHTWITYRLGEFYLNYAEAVYQYLGSPTATSAEFPMSADEAINIVRQRAGMPDFPTTLNNTEFWEMYKNERMVELAFEGHRFWDVRRWKEADKYFKNIYEMKITKNGDGTYNYNRQTVTRIWNDKMYFFPIPVDQILKNGNLEQNPGWK